jgi:methyl-accepting chemotaxis protein
MDKVTQGNAASAEESAASAEELNAQAVSMKQTVNKLAALIGENGTATAAVQPQKFRKPAAFSKPTHFSSNGHQNGNGHHAESKLKESRDSIPLEAAFRDF